jgi:phosphatidylserine/phosphatidylglycerophosphate/cardiolipin synthase-like enzyme
MKALTVAKERDGLRVVAYPGDQKILLAMSLSDELVNSGAKNLAGFAIWRTCAGNAQTLLCNRIGFAVGVSKQTTAKDRKWTPSDQAPFQKFRWVDVPPDGFSNTITYRVRALYFSGQGTDTTAGPEVTLAVAPAQPRHAKFHPAFTRRCIASQAYADKFHNQDIRPHGPKTPTFDTAPFQAQYEWLGADARQQLLAFIDDCKRDTTARIDVFAYDLDEPDIVAAICQLGRQRRLRAILDNAALHTKKGAPEIEAAKMIIAAAGRDNVRQGKFSRFQHNKVFIKRDRTGTAQRVLFGSMNFSVRGVYVQANNIIVVDDPATAKMFAAAFDEAFEHDVAAPPFRKSPIAQTYNVGSATDTAALPKFSLALSPHTDSGTSLGPMSQRVRSATRSVLFAVMEPTGQGPVLASLLQIAAKPTVFSYGTVETDKGLAVQSPNGAMGELTSFAALNKNVPWPFSKEFSGGPGMHIHDKFVVVDFNADHPTVFTGSSNLAAGGEQDNGDSLAMIEDEAIATMYAIEAVALFDHYHFRKAMQAAKPSAPLTLWYPGKPKAGDPWWQQYYDRSCIQMRDRYLFADLPLPAGLAATKHVDWAAVDTAAASRRAHGKTATSASRAPSKSTARAAQPVRGQSSSQRGRRTRNVRHAAATTAARRTRKVSTSRE